MTLKADEMERIVTQVARGEEPEVRESKEAAEFRQGVTREIEEARKSFFDFLTKIHEMPAFRDLESEAETSFSARLHELRSFPGTNKENPDSGAGHLLTRPVGQVILAMGIGRIAQSEAGLDLDAVFEKLNKWDDKGGFSQHLPASVWYGVTYDFGKNKIINTKKELAADLMKYMLLGDKEEGRKELLGRLIEARKVIMPTEPNTPYWRNFKGKDVPYNLDEPTKGVRLPNPIK